MILGRRGERPGHSVTTAHFQAAYPFLGQGSVGAPGVYIGADAYGGAWAFDPWEFYARRIVRSTNLIVIGGIGYAKSSFIKTYLFRQHLFGRDAWVIDIKGEYGPLGEALGYPPYVLRPGGEVRLNPITRRGSREAQLGLLRSVVQAALGRDLSPEEDAGLRVALDLVNEECASEDPTLPMVVDALLHPREAMVAGVCATSATDFAAANRESALALQRLCEGDLRGMFDGPTSPGIDLEAPMVILDLSAVQDSAALGVLMTCAAAWQQAIVLERKRRSERSGVPMRKLSVVVEEVWRVAPNPAVAEWLQSNFKLCRALGIQNILSLHKLTDFGAAGAAGSREAQVIQGLVSDAGCVIVYLQSPDQRPVLRGDLGLSETETELTMGLGLGEALWVMGQHSAPVAQRMSAFEREFTFTDEQMGVIQPVEAV
ncbi:MAG TPA: hypothetical protein VGH58_01365 [Solirubrobacterales bacterium]|jgi:hypothetical protein